MWVCGVRRRFDEFFFLFFFMATEFFFHFGFFFTLSKSLSEVKHVTRKHCALNILSGRSGGRWSVRPSVGRSGGQREKGQRWMLFFLPVLFVEETFLQRETRLTYSVTTSHSSLAHSRSKFMQNQQIFCGEVFIFLSFFIFFAWPRWWENGW